eukprot:9501568-Pyramimonas_sp.AAC.2
MPTEMPTEAPDWLMYAERSRLSVSDWWAQTSELHKTFGGTIISKYNRGRLGQFFISLEHSGDLFFHREVAPWCAPVDPL